MDPPVPFPINSRRQIRSLGQNPSETDPIGVAAGLTYSGLATAAVTSNPEFCYLSLYRR